MCLRIVGQNCDFLPILYRSGPVKRKKWVPTKICFILHGIGRTIITDQGESGFLIVGLFVFPLCALEWLTKTVIFLPILYRSGPVKPKNGVRRKFALFSVGLVGLPLLMKENVVF